MNKSNKIEIDKDALKDYTKLIAAEIKNVTPTQAKIVSGLCHSYLHMAESVNMPATTVFICTVAAMLKKMEFTEMQALLYTSFAHDISKEMSND